jgi:hypothetical protein
MTEDEAELETRSAEAKRNEKPDLAPRENDDRHQPSDGLSNEREGHGIYKLPAPRPRWPLVL